MRSSLALVLGGVVACGGAEPAVVEAPAPSPAPAAAPVEPDPEWRPTVSSRTIVVSAPRSDWPCGFDVLAGKVQQLEVTIEYQGPTWCFLPVDALADGVIGCPTKMTSRGVNGGGEYETTLRYDSDNHLVSVTTAGGTWTYTWDAGALIAASNPNERILAKLYRYVEVDGGVELQRDTADGPEAEFLLRFESDKLVEIELPAFERRDTIVWNGERIQQIERTGRRADYRQVSTPRYDCE